MYSSPAAASLSACIPLRQKCLSREQAPFMVSWAPGLLEAVTPSPPAGGDATHLPPPLGEESTQRQMGTVFPREPLFVPSFCFPGERDDQAHLWFLCLDALPALCHLLVLLSSFSSQLCVASSGKLS